MAEAGCAAAAATCAGLHMRSRSTRETGPPTRRSLGRIHNLDAERMLALAPEQPGRRQHPSDAQFSVIRAAGEAADVLAREPLLSAGYDLSAVLAGGVRKRLLSADRARWTTVRPSAKHLAAGPARPAEAVPRLRGWRRDRCSRRTDRAGPGPCALSESELGIGGKQPDALQTVSVRIVNITLDRGSSFAFMTLVHAVERRPGGSGLALVFWSLSGLPRDDSRGATGSIFGPSVRVRGA